MENIDLTKDKRETSLVGKSKEPQRSLLNLKQNESNRCKSVEPLSKKQNLEETTIYTTFDKSPAKKVSIVHLGMTQKI